MTYKDAFGLNLRRLRTAAGLSQMELGRRADLDRAGIWVLEHGNRQPTLLTTLTLRDSLGTTMDELALGASWNPDTLKIEVDPSLRRPISS